MGITCSNSGAHGPAAFDTAMHHSVHACLCVLAEAAATSLPALWLPTVAALFERRPLSVPSASCNRIGSSALLSTQLVFARNLFSAAVWMCARLCTLNRESDACPPPPPFYSRKGKAANDTPHTPLTLEQLWPGMYLHTNVTGWGSLWRYSDNWQSSAEFVRTVAANHGWRLRTIRWETG